MLFLNLKLRVNSELSTAIEHYVLLVAWLFTGIGFRELKVMLKTFIEIKDVFEVFTSIVRSLSHLFDIDQS